MTTKISALPVGTAPTGTETIPAVQNGTTVSLTVSQIQTPTATTGTGATVRANTPTLVTPVLGVATATSINGVTISSSGLTFAGSSSGTVSLEVAAAAGTGTKFRLPATNGSSGYTLQTDGSGVTSWVASGSGDMLKSDNLTGLGNYATARSNLGLAIGTNVQAFDADLSTLAALGNWKVAYTDGSSVQTALALGAAGTLLAGGGLTSAPTFSTLSTLHIVADNATSALTAGFTSASVSQGTKTSGTYTFDPTVGSIQNVVNNGAHTFAPPATHGAWTLDYTNSSSAGALTVTGWTKVDGDAFDTTDTHAFRCFLSNGTKGSYLSVKRMV